MNALIWVSLVWVCFPLRTLAFAKLVASLYGAGVVGSLFTAPRGRGSSIPRMRTTFHASLGTLLADHSGFTLLASGFCGEACVTACVGEPLAQRPRVESCLWAKFPQTLGIFKAQAEDGVTGAFLLVLWGGHCQVPKPHSEDSTRPSSPDGLSLFTMGDVPVSSLFMRSICSQEVVVKSMGSRARAGQASYPLCI